MLIADLLEDLQRHGEEEIEFYLVENSKMTKLRVFVCDGEYLLKKHDMNGDFVDSIIVLSLTRATDAKAI